MILDNKEGLSALLVRLDIMASLDSIEALWADVRNRRVAKKHGSVVQISMNHVYQSLVDLHRILHDIESATLQHDSKWFSSIRAVSYHNLLDELKTTKSVLDKRVDMLIKVLMLPKNAPILQHQNCTKTWLKSLFTPNKKVCKLKLSTHNTSQAHMEFIAAA